MNWATIWVNLFTTTSFLGIDIGFWIGMSVVLLIVILINVVFWSMKPKKRSRQNKDHTRALSDEQENCHCGI